MLTDMETLPPRQRLFAVSTGIVDRLDMLGSCAAASCASRDAAEMLEEVRGADACPAHEGAEATADAAAYTPAWAVAGLLCAHGGQASTFHSDTAWILAESMIVLASWEIGKSVSIAGLGSVHRPWLYAAALKSLTLPLSSTLAHAPVYATYSQCAAQLGQNCVLEMPLLSVGLDAPALAKAVTRGQMIEMFDYVPTVLKASTQLQHLLEAATRSMDQRFVTGFRLDCAHAFSTAGCVIGSNSSPVSGILFDDAINSRFNIVDYIMSRLDDAAIKTFAERVEMRETKQPANDVAPAAPSARLQPMPPDDPRPGTGPATGSVDAGIEMSAPPRTDVRDAHLFGIGCRSAPDEHRSGEDETAWEDQDNPFSRENMYLTLLGKRKGPPAERS